MEKRLMTVVAAIAVSTSMAFAQTSISGTVISNDDEEPIGVIFHINLFAYLFAIPSPKMA